MSEVRPLYTSHSRVWQGLKRTLPEEWGHPLPHSFSSLHLGWKG